MLRVAVAHQYFNLYFSGNLSFHPYSHLVAIISLHDIQCMFCKHVLVMSLCYTVYSNVFVLYDFLHSCVSKLLNWIESVMLTAKIISVNKHRQHNGQRKKEIKI